jgi:hypothetical protein
MFGVMFALVLGIVGVVYIRRRGSRKRATVAAR